MLHKIEFKINVSKLYEICTKFISLNPFPNHNQLCFLNTKNHKPDPEQGTGNQRHPEANMFTLNEHDFTEFLPEWKDSMLYEIYKNFPLPVTRMRLMRVPPKRTYSMHRDGDNEIRYHIAVKTNPHAYFVYGDTLDMIHVPADGNCYKFDVSRIHSYVNFNPIEERWHIVLNAKI